MGLKYPSGCFCRITAPKPYDDTSADTMVSRSELYTARAGVFVMSSVIDCSDTFCGSPHIHTSAARTKGVLSSGLIDGCIWPSD